MYSTHLADISRPLRFALRTDVRPLGRPPRSCLLASVTVRCQRLRSPSQGGGTGSNPVGGTAAEPFSFGVLGPSASGTPWRRYRENPAGGRGIGPDPCRIPARNPQFSVRTCRHLAVPPPRNGGGPGVLPKVQLSRDSPTPPKASFWCSARDRAVSREGGDVEWSVRISSSSASAAPVLLITRRHLAPSWVGRKRRGWWCSACRGRQAPQDHRERPSEAERLRRGCAIGPAFSTSSLAWRRGPSPDTPADVIARRSARGRTYRC